MPAQLLKGKEVSKAIKDDLTEKIGKLPFVLKLRFIRVGEDPASVSYVKSKQRMAESIGVDAYTHALPETTAQNELLTLIKELNADDDIDGILVQLPLPKHMNEQVILEAVAPAKDVDGLHTTNVGCLWTDQEASLPCTPAGLIQIMNHYNLPIEGKHTVIVGRSNLVGKPAAGLFLRNNATVSVAHSRTRDLAKLTKEADILVVAVGKAGFITAEMVKAGAVVLDVGLTRVENKIVGDVHPEVAEVAGHLTPMPGGTGRVTVAMLMLNTFKAAIRRRESA